MVIGLAKPNLGLTVGILKNDVITIWINHKDRHRIHKMTKTVLCVYIQLTHVDITPC